MNIAGKYDFFIGTCVKRKLYILNMFLNFKSWKTQKQILEKNNSRWMLFLD